MKRLLRTALWALILGLGLWLFLTPLDALGGVLVLPPAYHSGLRILLGAIWAVGVIAIFVHGKDDDPTPPGPPA